MRSLAFCSPRRRGPLRRRVRLGTGHGHTPASIVASGTTMELFIPTDRAIVTNVIRATPLAAWNALPQVYADFGIEVKERSDAGSRPGQLQVRDLAPYRRNGAVQVPGVRVGAQGAVRRQLPHHDADPQRGPPHRRGAARIDTLHRSDPAPTPRERAILRSSAPLRSVLEREIAERVRLYAEGR